MKSSLTKCVRPVSNVESESRLVIQRVGSTFLMKFFWERRAAASKGTIHQMRTLSYACLGVCQPFLHDDKFQRVSFHR